MAVDLHLAGGGYAQITGQIEAVFKEAAACERGIGRQGRRQTHISTAEGGIERLPPAAVQINQIITDRNCAGCAGYVAVEDRDRAVGGGAGGKSDTGGVVDIQILESGKPGAGIRKVDILIVRSVENNPAACRGEDRTCTRVAAGGLREMPPELKDTVGEIAYAGGYVVVINMGKCGIALNGDIIRRVGRNETVTGIIGNSDQEITICNK